MFGVSPSPRRSPVETPCSPSNSWNIAAHEQQAAPEGMDGVARREHPDERPWDEDERQGRRGHERRADQQRDAPGARGCGRVAASDRVANPDGAGRGNAERHHEGQARQVERDLMGRQRHGSSRPASALAAANTPSSSVTCAAAGSPSRSSRARAFPFGIQATLNRLT